MTADSREVAAAAAAVALGESAAAAYWQAAMLTPGMGAQVAAIRPQVRRRPVVEYADLTVGGIGPGGYHGNLPRQASGVLEGVPVPSVRSDSILYLPASSPRTRRPTLTARVRNAWRALWSR